MEIGNHSQGLIDENNKLILLWTPKAGCTTAVIMMLRHMNLLNEALKIHPFVHNYRPKFYEKYGHVTLKHLLSKKYFVIKVIRNPYDRAVSSYLHILESWRRFIDIDMSFTAFLRLVRKKFNTPKIVGYVRTIALVHGCRQYVKGEELYIRKYIKLENPVAIKQINKQLKINLDITVNDKKLIPHHHKHSDIESTKYLGDIQFSKLPTLLPKTYKSFYNDTTKKLVEIIYGKDIQKYEYQFYN